MARHGQDTKKKSAQERATWVAELKELISFFHRTRKLLNRSTAESRGVDCEANNRHLLPLQYGSRFFVLLWEETLHVEAFERKYVFACGRGTTTSTTNAELEVARVNSHKIRMYFHVCRCCVTLRAEKRCPPGVVMWSVSFFSAPKPGLAAVAFAIEHRNQRQFHLQIVIVEIESRTQTFCSNWHYQKLPILTHATYRSARIECGLSRHFAKPASTVALKVFRRFAAARCPRHWRQLSEITPLL